jgi:hypothetical protein
MEILNVMLNPHLGKPDKHFCFPACLLFAATNLIANVTVTTEIPEKHGTIVIIARIIVTAEIFETTI